MQRVSARRGRRPPERGTPAGIPAVGSATADRNGGRPVPPARAFRRVGGRCRCRLRPGDDVCHPCPVWHALSTVSGVRHSFGDDADDARGVDMDTDPALAATAPPPLSMLAAMHGSGELAVRYREVAALVDRMASSPYADSDMARAGALLRLVEPAELCAAHPDLDLFEVQVVGHDGAGVVADTLVAHLARHGIAAHVEIGGDGAGGPVHELDGLGTPPADLALCIIDARIVFDALGPVWTGADVRCAVECAVGELSRHAASYDHHGGADLVLTTIPLQQVHLRHLVDRDARTELSILWREANARLLALGREFPRVHVVDLDALGEPRPAGLGRELAHLVRALLGRSKTVLALDAGSTLWGTRPATSVWGQERFGELRRCIAQLVSQGVVVAVGGRDDHDDRADVAAMLDVHPDSVLCLADVTAAVPDRVVFAAHPSSAPAAAGLQVAPLDGDATLHVDSLLRDGWFDTIDRPARRAARTGEVISLRRPASRRSDDGARGDLASSTG